MCDKTVIASVCCLGYDFIWCMWSCLRRRRAVRYTLPWESDFSPSHCVYIYIYNYESSFVGRM